jgi:hypothetical protein
MDMNQSTCTTLELKVRVWNVPLPPLRQRVKDEGTTFFIERYLIEYFADCTLL